MKPEEKAKIIKNRFIRRLNEYELNNPRLNQKETDFASAMYFLGWTASENEGLVQEVIA